MGWGKVGSPEGRDSSGAFCPSPFEHAKKCISGTLSVLRFLAPVPLWIIASCSSGALNKATQAAHKLSIYQHIFTSLTENSREVGLSLRQGFVIVDFQVQIFECVVFRIMKDAGDGALSALCPVGLHDCVLCKISDL